MTRLLCALSFTLALSGSLAARELSVCDDVSDPQTLDPHKQFSEKNHVICQQIFDGLIRFDPEGRIEPALAVSWKRISDTRIRFKLREGVSFHNGEPFDAAAVKFSIERYLDPRTGFPALGFIDSISGAETIDSHTVDVITRYPDGLMLNRIAGFMLMVPPIYLKEKGSEYFAQHPVGTGAFIFKDWEKGSLISLAANKRYWMEGFPKVDGLVFKFIPYDEQFAALLAGKVDLITDLPGTQTLKVKSTPKLTILKRASFYTMPFALNLSSGPLSSLDVRKAVNHAINKENLIRYDLLGNGRIIATLSMPGEAGHNAGLKPYEYDPAKAKKLLSSAGYPAGFTLNFLVKRNAERTARIIASDLKKVGINLNITLVSDADMITEFKSGKYPLFIGTSPDPMCHSYFIQSVVLGANSPFSWGGEPHFTELLNKMIATVNMEESRKMAEKIDKYVYDNALSVFTYQKMQIYGYLKGLSFKPYVSGMPYFFSAEFSGGQQ